MKTISSLIFAALLAGRLFGHPDHDTAPGKSLATATRTGNGMHLYETVPGWGAIPDGEPIGSTHGGVAVSKDGSVYVSTNGERAICVFSPEGKYLRSIAADCAGTHSLLIREEEGVEYLYGAHNAGQRVVKLTLSGELVWEIKDSEQRPIPETLKGLTAVAVGPDGRVYVAVGYGSNLIHVFDQDGALLKTFGAKGENPDQFKTCHGLTIDTRFDQPRLLVADRENRSLKHYDLDGNFLSVHATGLRRPCAMAILGDVCAVAELQGRVTIVDRSGHPVAFLGDNPNREQWAKYRTPLSEIPAAFFAAPHGIAYDQAGNLYVQDWNETGRVTKLRKL